MEESSQSKRRFKLGKKFLMVFLALIVLVVLGMAGYFYMQYRNTQNLLQNPNQAALDETKNLLAMVGKLIELPTNESPTIATVSDVTKLSSQQFFKNAKNGDKVLIYSQSRKAILYRPSLNRIIEVATINIDNNSLNANRTITANATPSATVTPTLKKVPSLTPQPTK